MMKRTCRTVLAAAALMGCFAFLPAELHAQTSQQIKANMKNRAPVLDRLRNQCAIGEANTGFLAILQKNLKPDEIKAVEAENADRALVYKAIAKKQGTTPELVGKRRALKIHEITRKGTMIQNENGDWSKK